MRIIRNRWSRLRSLQPGRDSTSRLLPEGKFHRPATTCWSASSAGAVVALTRDRDAAPIATPSYDRFQPTFFQQFLDIPQRQRISKIQADRTENQRRFCLPPLEDRRPRTHFRILSRCQPGPTEVAKQPCPDHTGPVRSVDTSAPMSSDATTVDFRFVGWRRPASGEIQNGSGNRASALLEVRVF